MATELARELWRSFWELFSDSAVHGALHSTAEAIGLSPGVMKALWSLRPGEAVPMKHLASEWHCDASYVTYLVDELEQRAIVERRSHPSDRRAKMVALTAKGGKLRARMMDMLVEPPAFVSDLPAADCRSLLGLMEKLVVAARARQDPAGDERDAASGDPRLP